MDERLTSGDEGLDEILSQLGRPSGSEGLKQSVLVLSRVCLPAVRSASRRRLLGERDRLSARLADSPAGR